MTELPTLYEYYASGNITEGLSTNQSYFMLNRKNFTLLGGSMHYFRIPNEYWREGLRKIRATGLNTVTTYVPWSLHEPEPNLYDFGANGTDMGQFLNLTSFLKTAQEEDLLAIIRPGPFICAELEFGGLPSWLLRAKDIKILLPILAALQFTTGGPIIAFQIENEYGSTNNTDAKYLRELVTLHRDNGIVELLFTSDGADYGTRGSLPGELLMTVNFGNQDPASQLDQLKKHQPDKPIMVTEFWSGWFDHWNETHHSNDLRDFEHYLEKILEYPASVNIYMFHGGTNWGFLNGANGENGDYKPTTTSYDYNAPIHEGGNYNYKYNATVNLLKKYSEVKLKTPTAPDMRPKVAYGDIGTEFQLNLSEMIGQISQKLKSECVRPIAMEVLPIRNNSGQNYGYVVYRKPQIDLPKNSKLTIQGHVHDTVVVLVNGVSLSEPLQSEKDLNGFGYWRILNGSLSLKNGKLTNATLELVVENWGRTNFGSLGSFVQYKGVWEGGIFLNGREITNWEIVSLEFRRKWTSGLNGWRSTTSMIGPALYKASLLIEDDPQDTYVDMSLWTKGIVMVNSFVLGRYASPLGPQQTLYLPATLLKKGRNELIVFEHFTAAPHVRFSDKMIYRTSPN